MDIGLSIGAAGGSAHIKPRRFGACLPPATLVRETEIKKHALHLDDYGIDGDLDIGYFVTGD